MKRVSKEGLTLAEILVSLALLGVISLILVGVFSKLLASGGKQANQSVARRLADKVLTRAVREGSPNWGGTGTTYDDVVALNSQRSDGTTEFTYRVQVDDVKSLGLGQLKRVQVQVEWWPKSTNKESMRMGLGRLSLTVDQVVYTGK